MNTAGQIVRSSYLETLRETVRNILMPELSTPATRNAAQACEVVLAAMMAPTEKPPEVPSDTLSKLPHVTRQSIQDYLDKKFSGVRVASCQQVAGGRSKLTVLVGLEAAEALPPGIVLRIDNPGSAQNTKVTDEFPALQALFAQGALAPEPLWVEADPAMLGAPFLVMRRMDGQPPGNLWNAAAVPQKLGFALAQALAGIHGANAQAAWADTPADARACVSDMIAGLQQKWQTAESDISIAIESAFQWMRRNTDCISGGAVPVHGDVHFGNVLAVDDRITCLTDWEFAHAGHAAEDLAFCRPYIEAIMPWSDFVEHYCAHGGLPPTREQLRFFAGWGYLRNTVLAAGALHAAASGRILDVQTLYITLHARARVEANLSVIVSDLLADC